MLNCNLSFGPNITTVIFTIFSIALLLSPSLSLSTAPPSKAKKILLTFDGSLRNEEDFIALGRNLYKFPEYAERDDELSFLTNPLKIAIMAGADINVKRDISKRTMGVPDQIILYERGIGGRNDNEMIQNLNGFRGELKQQIDPMWKQLNEVYEKGDMLYIIGYSRGAAAARKFACELNERGISTKDGHTIQSPPVEFLGCFDTVSNQYHRNLPKTLWARIRRAPPPSNRIGEKGTVSPNIKKAVSLLSLDDNRMFAHFPRFPPIQMGDDDRVHEVWFAGEHGDIGGGYISRHAMHDYPLQYMIECMNNITNPLTFLPVDDLKPECLVLDKYPDNVVDKTLIYPDPKPDTHLHMQPFQLDKPSFRPIYVMRDDKYVPDEPAKIHVSVLHHMEAMKKKQDPWKYFINSNLKKNNFVVVGKLGVVLDAETKKMKELIEQDSQK